MDKLNELRERHDQLLAYHSSLMKTHDRCVKAANKSGTICGHRRAILIGRNILKRSRSILVEATAIYNEYKRLRDGVS